MCLSAPTAGKLCHGMLDFLGGSPGSKPRQSFTFILFPSLELLGGKRRRHTPCTFYRFYSSTFELLLIVEQVLIVGNCRETERGCNEEYFEAG